MEKQELKSKWDELARELGAQVSPETEQREQAISTATTEAAPAPAVHAAPKDATVSPPPKRSAADWDKLAGDLGLPPSEPAEQPPEPQVEQRRPTPAETARETSAEPPPRERTQRPEQRAPRERREARKPRERREPPGEHRQHAREQHGRERRDTREAREPREPRTRPIEKLEKPSEPQRETMREPEVPPALPREEPARPAAVSLWHKIFGSPAEQSAKLSDVSPRPSETDETSQTREETEVVSSGDEIRSLSGADVTAAGFVEELERAAEASVTSDETTLSERTRDRPRRRRRGGRGRKPGERREEGRRDRDSDSRRLAVETGDEFDDLGMTDTEEEADSDLAGEPYTADESADGAEIESANSNHTKAQRSIPSWDEAIGFIVETNMQSRSQRRPPSRGGAARGRSRGRRKS